MAILSTQVDRERNVGLIDTWVGARAVGEGDYRMGRGQGSDSLGDLPRGGEQAARETDPQMFSRDGSLSFSGVQAPV